MEKSQLIVLWVGIAIVVLMGIFPPWVAIAEASHFYLGYSFILSPPEEMKRGEMHIAVIELTRLLTQWIMVAVIVGGLIITFKDKKPKD